MDEQFFSLHMKSYHVSTVFLLTLDPLDLKTTLKKEQPTFTQSHHQTPTAYLNWTSVALSREPPGSHFISYTPVGNQRRTTEVPTSITSKIRANWNGGCHSLSFSSLVITWSLHTLLAWATLGGPLPFFSQKSLNKKWTQFLCSWGLSRFKEQL